ncbi:MAG: discoidin domain-containing protein [Verrucomicrobiota bacterium]|nr:discoidin domain-containing protein [Verrucomicrobiota bacterium]|tara:strand:- start:2349 stop:3062 length:714 start_codon:yes stop_codon:yes gene_type:complete
MQKNTLLKIVRVCVFSLAFLFLTYGPNADAADSKKISIKAPPGMAALPLDLPKPAFAGTPQNIKGVKQLEKPLGRPRPPFFAPKGVKNLALGKKITGSDEEPIVGDIKMITDGDKKAADGSYVELGPFTQYIQVDLEAEKEIYAVLLWHYHKQARVYFDVVIQVSNDSEFAKSTTIYNNDHDNSAEQGVGKDNHYVETSEGRLVDAKGVKGRYVRFYSGGNNASDLNHYIEVEVYGK